VTFLPGVLPATAFRPRGHFYLHHHGQLSVGDEPARPEHHGGPNEHAFTGDVGHGERAQRLQFDIEGLLAGLYAHHGAVQVVGLKRASVEAEDGVGVRRRWSCLLKPGRPPR
jgi:hypothetical protein